MTSATLDHLIDASKELSAVERLKLISAVTASLYEQQPDAVSTVIPAASLDDIVGLRRTAPIDNIDRLVADFWPEDEEDDDLIEFIYRQRQEDRNADS